MARRLVVRLEAVRDIETHATRLARDRPDAAHRFVIAVETALELIRTVPFLAPVRSFRRPTLVDVRAWVVPGQRNIVVFYRVTPTEIDVMRVLHSSRNAPLLLQAVAPPRPRR